MPHAASLPKLFSMLTVLIFSVSAFSTEQGEKIEYSADGSFVNERNMTAEPGDSSAVNDRSPDPYNLSGKKADGYRGIWYRLGRDYEYGDKYSGGLGTYTANHKPLAVYSEEANTTFFVVGGTPAADQQYLLILAGAYDHAAHKVSRPTIVYDKGAEGVYDAHDNPSITLDAEGHIWVFVAGRNVRRDGTVLRSTQPYSIEAFETIRIWPGMTYPQPWFDGTVFHFFFTKYTRPRNLYYASSRDGVTWSDEIQLARFGGHYQISGIHQQSGRIATFFNYHPDSNVDRRTNLYYMESADGGENWTTVDGIPLELPLTEVQNPALAIDYESQELLQYTSDLNWDADGNPLLLYVASPSFMPGPAIPDRQWHLTRWTGTEWTTSVITETMHSYDMGSLHVEGSRWMAFVPSGGGAQLWGAGGEVEIWTTDNSGQKWIRQQAVTRGSQYNHNYVRRPVNARDPFFALWADGDTEQESASHFYFSNRDGTRVWRLPYTMQQDWETPEEVSFHDKK